MNGRLTVFYEFKTTFFKFLSKGRHISRCQGLQKRSDGTDKSQVLSIGLGLGFFFFAVANIWFVLCLDNKS